MTVCIAAISRRDRTIVTVSDLMLSTDTDSIDTDTVKTEAITDSRRWLAMFAGDPHIRGTVIRSVRKMLKGSGETLPEVAGAFEQAFRFELKRKIEGEILSPFGVDRDKFIADGRELFGDDEYPRLLYELRKADLETDFPVAGFDSEPRIFSVSNPGTWREHTNVGFHAIGMGNFAAMGALYATYTSKLGGMDMLYRACEAKFRAEATPTVGKKTFVVQMEETGQHHWLHPEYVTGLREIWQKEGIPPIPPSATKFITDHLGGLTWAADNS